MLITSSTEPIRNTDIMSKNLLRQQGTMTFQIVPQDISDIDRGALHAVAGCEALK